MRLVLRVSVLIIAEVASARLLIHTRPLHIDNYLGLGLDLIWDETLTIPVCRTPAARFWFTQHDAFTKYARVQGTVPKLAPLPPASRLPCLHRGRARGRGGRYLPWTSLYSFTREIATARGSSRPSR